MGTTEGLKHLAEPFDKADRETVTFTYTNWQGETRTRTVLPVRIWFGSTQWHPEPQWLLEAEDAEKGYVAKDFALKDVRNWKAKEA